MTPVSQEIVLDWEAYWKAFQEAHGGDPVPHAGRLLFRDGWTYSSTDHAGPEWSPPKDSAALLALRRAYWSFHRARVRRELAAVSRQLGELEDFARLKSVPLMVRVEFKTEDGRVERKAERLDLTQLRAEREHLAGLLAEADAELSVLPPEPHPSAPPVRWADELPPSALAAEGIGPRQPREDQGVL